MSWIFPKKSDKCSSLLLITREISRKRHRSSITIEFHVICILGADRKLTILSRSERNVRIQVYLRSSSMAVRGGTIRRRFRRTYWRDRSDTRTWLAQRGKPKYFADTRPCRRRQKAVTRPCRLKNKCIINYEEVDFVSIVRSNARKQERLALTINYNFKSILAKWSIYYTFNFSYNYMYMKKN